MITFEGRRIYLACGITDGRKSINGLCAMVKYSFQKEPTEDSIFVFCNRDRDRLKILEYDGNGYWLYLKRLDECRFQWPDDDVNKTMMLTNDDLNHLLSGPGLTKKLKSRGRKKQVA